LRAHPQTFFFCPNGLDRRRHPGPGKQCLGQAREAVPCGRRETLPFRYPLHVTGAHRGRPFQIARAAAPSNPARAHLQREARAVSPFPAPPPLKPHRCSRPHISLSSHLLLSALVFTPSPAPAAAKLLPSPAPGSGRRRPGKSARSFSLPLLMVWIWAVDGFQIQRGVSKIAEIRGGF